MKSLRALGSGFRITVFSRTGIPSSHAPCGWPPCGDFSGRLAIRVYFIDTSALLKAYLDEKGSETVREALRLLGRSAFVSDLVLIEALGRLTRKRRGGEISKSEYLKLYQQLQLDVQHTFYVVPVNADILAKAFHRVHFFRDKTAGAFDHIHVCTAEYLQTLYPAETVHIMCADRGLSTIATDNGFEVFNPEKDAVSSLDTSPLGF